MRLIIIALVSACASTTIPLTTTPLQYNCGDRSFTRDGDTLAAGSAALRLSAHADDGDHFQAPEGDRLVELTLPSDPRGDAIERVFAPAANNQLVRSQVCRVHGGYTDVASRYVAGESLDALAKEETRGDRDAAYMLIRDGIAKAQRQLRRDR